MMKVPVGRFCAVALGLIVAASRAPAAIDVGDKPQITFKAVDGTPVSMEKLKGRIVVVDFWATWCGPCMAMADEMVAIHKSYHDRGLQMVGISLDQDKAALVRVVKEKGFAWPQYFDGKGWDNAFWKQYGSNGIPYTLLVGPDGTVLWKGHPGGGLKQQIEKAFKDHPPKLVDEKAVARAKELLDEAESRSRANDTAAALKLLAKVPEEATADEDTAARLAKLSKSVEGDADRMLVEVNRQVERGDYGPAVARLKDLSRALSGTSVAGKARRQLNDLLARPDVRQKVESAERAAWADEALAVAVDLQKQKKDELAYARFKSVAKEFAGTSAAALAGAQVQRYEGDAAFVKRVTDKEVGGKARAALSMARSYRTAGKSEQARQKYQSVIAEFPNTQYAETARQELSALSR